jgi:hypothetical protein
MRSALLLGLLLFASHARAAHELGLNIHLSDTVGPNVTHDAGLKWVRIDLNWSIFQPADAAPDFTVADAVVNAARAKGLNVLAILAYTPAWASASNSDPSTHDNDIPIAGKYEAFVTLAVNHFKDRVTYFELWNEPDLTQFFEGTPQQFVDLILKPGADAVHGACPTCKVVSPGLAALASVPYDTWLDTILSQAQDKIDIVNGHIYAGFVEDDPTVGTTSDSFLNKLEAHRLIQIAGITVFEGKLSFKEVMDKHGCTKPFWLTETGLEAALGDATALAQQKTFYRRVLEKTLTRPWWTATIFYESFDPQGSPMFHWGITQDAGAGTYTKKPAFDFLALAAQGQAFGGVNPACSDGLDNDGDGLVDFPADPDCLGATGLSEGTPIVSDGGVSDGGVSDGGSVVSVDASSPVPDGMSGAVDNPPGGGPQRPPSSGCTLGGASEVPLVLVLLCAIAVLAARRRA